MRYLFQVSAVLAIAGAALCVGGAPAFATDTTSVGSLPGETTAKGAIAAQTSRRSAIAKIQRWGIQLRHLNREAVAASAFDLMVVDHAPHPDATAEAPFTSREIAKLKVMPDGSRRIILAYLSIGEAESYRYYWQHEWDAQQTRPSWLGAENPDWPGNFRVTFTNPDWQRIIFGTPDSYLDRIIAAGFDGVYLDRADAYQDIEPSSADAENDMTRFLIRLADYARRIDPKFVVILQNAEELLSSRTLASRLDGVAKEDLMYGYGNTEEANPPTMLSDSLAYLRRGRQLGLKVLVLEYLTAPEKIAAVRALTKREGFVLHLTERLLGTLSLEAPRPGEADRPSSKNPN